MKKGSRRALVMLTATLALASTAAGAEPAAAAGRLEQARKIARDVEREYGLPVSAVTTTSGVASLELVDPVAQTTRHVPTGNGLHFTLCGSAQRRCRLPAYDARAQALALARRTLLETTASLVVVALPQAPTHHLQLVFERDVLYAIRQSAARATRVRLYAMAGLTAAGGKDSLLLVRI